MSALPPKADIETQSWNVRYVPIADVSPLFDHLVGELLKVRRHVEAQRLRGLEIDDELILRRRLHRHVGWLLTFQDAVDVAGAAAIQVDPVRPI